MKRKLYILLAMIMLTGCAPHNESENQANKEDAQNIKSEQEYMDSAFLAVVEENELAQKNSLDNLNEQLNENYDVEISTNYWEKEYPKMLTDYANALQKYEGCMFEDEQLGNMAQTFIENVSSIADWQTEGGVGNFLNDKEAFEALDEHLKLCGEFQKKYNIDTGYSNEYYKVYTELNAEKANCSINENINDEYQNIFVTEYFNHTDITFEDFSIYVAVYYPDGTYWRMAECVIGDIMDVGEEFSPGEEGSFEEVYELSAEEIPQNCQFLIYGFSWVFPEIE
ncbi:MAG: hypothetical protein ACI4S2_04370 [Lachnospiraceae bacterium]